METSFNALARAYVSADDHQRETLRAEGAIGGPPLLLGFSDRMANLAERRAGPEPLDFALVACSLGDLANDERENIRCPALMVHVARKLALDSTGLSQTATRPDSLEPVLVNLSDANPVFGRSVRCERNVAVAFYLHLLDHDVSGARDYEELRVEPKGHGLPMGLSDGKSYRGIVFVL